jgi:hypothetical protein
VEPNKSCTENQITLKELHTVAPVVDFVVEEVMVGDVHSVVALAAGGAVLKPLTLLI